MKPPRPRVPTTRRSASSLSSTSAGAGASSTILVVMVAPGATVLARTVASSATFSLVSRDPCGSRCVALTRGGDDLEESSGQPSLGCRPVQGASGAVRAVDADNDPVRVAGICHVRVGTRGHDGFAAHGRFDSYKRLVNASHPLIIGARRPVLVGPMVPTPSMESPNA